MVSANDPIESFFNTIQAFKGALWPLESGFRRAAKDIESCWPSFNSKRKGTDSIEFIAQFDGCERNGQFQIGVLKKKSAQSVVSDEKKKGFSVKGPIKNIVGAFAQNLGSRGGLDGRKGGKERDVDKERDGNESCANCLQFAVHFSLLANSFVQAFPSPFKGSKKRLQKQMDEEKGGCDVKCKVSLSELRVRELKRRHVRVAEKDVGVNKEDKHVRLESFECFLGFIVDQLAQNLHIFDQVVRQEFEGDNLKASSAVDPPVHFSHLRAVASIWEGRKANVNDFLGNLRFARVGGVPPSIVGVTSSVKEETGDGVANGSREESNSSTSVQKLAGGILSIPLSNVERLKSTLSTVSLTELIELVPQIGRPSKEYPDKKKLFSVQDFFKCKGHKGRKNRYSCICGHRQSGSSLKPSFDSSLPPISSGNPSKTTLQKRQHSQIANATGINIVASGIQFNSACARFHRRGRERDFGANGAEVTNEDLKLLSFERSWSPRDGPSRDYVAGATMDLKLSNITKPSPKLKQKAVQYQALPMTGKSANDIAISELQNPR